MSRLYFSIIIVVLGSLFFISWGLDTFVAQHVSEEEDSELILYKKLIEGFSLQLSANEPNQLDAELAKLSALYQVSLRLIPAKSIALPSSVHQQLSNQGGLLLATESNTFLIKKVINHPQKLLQLQLPALQQSDQKIDFILTTVLYVGVCCILLLWLLPLTRRIFLLTHAAARIGKGDLAVRVPKSRFSYITTLETSFNRMATQIEKLMADNKILARSLSHDIRTPMSCLRFGIEAALDAKSIEKKNTYIERMDTELTRMEDMTSAFLEYAGLERKGINLKLIRTNIDEFIKTVVWDFHPLADQHNLTINYQSDNSTSFAMLDNHWLYQAMQNLIVNAVNYASSTIQLSFHCSSNYIHIYIEDDGKGIPESKLAIIFTPFVKLDANKSREKGHFGLGLAITEKVVDWHKGTISASNSSDLGGAKFTLSFPRTP